MDLLDDIADQVGNVLAEHQVPHTEAGMKYASLTLLHLAAVMVGDEIRLAPGDVDRLGAFFRAVVTKDQEAQERLARELLGDDLVMIDPGVTLQ